MPDGNSYTHRNFVYQVLEMHLAIHNSLQQGNRFPTSHDWVGKFIGFDGNHESERLSFANTLVTAIAEFAPIRNPVSAVPDSHSSATWRYEPMLEAWALAPDQEHLNSEDLRRMASFVEENKEASMRTEISED